MSLLDWIYPPRCMACQHILPIEQYRQRAYFLCANCEGFFVPLAPPLCARCGAPTAREGLLCMFCRDREGALDGNYAAYAYAELVRELFHEMKFRNRRYIAIGFGALLADHCAHHPTQHFANAYDLLVPVPIHPRKLRSRGFNQAALLARALSAALGIPVAAGLLRRVKNTPPQSGLTVQQRRENIRDAFAVDNRQTVQRKKICLVDDIYTTGATLDACASLLKQSGAASVHGITFSAAVTKKYDK